MKKWALALFIFQFPQLVFAGMPNGMGETLFAVIYIVVSSIIIFSISNIKFLRKLLLTLINLISTFAILPLTINLAESCSFGMNEGLCFFADTPILLCGFPALVTTLAWYVFKKRTI